MDWDNEFSSCGNVIKIISSNPDSNYDGKYFFVERLYDDKLVIVSDKESITLGITDQELERLHLGGVRGFRCNLVNGIGLSLEAAKKLAHRVKQFNWHTQFLLDVQKFPNLTETFSDFPIDVVIDHMGRPVIDKGINEPGFQSLISFLKTGKAWSKLSAPYRTSKDPLFYRDMIPFAQALVEAVPDQLVWGFDWPHVNMAPGTPMPDDGELVNQIEQWIQNPLNLQKIMVDNPTRLYDF